MRRRWGCGRTRTCCATAARRTFSVMGGDEREIQQLLGHRALETTALHTTVDVSDLR